MKILAPIIAAASLLMLPVVASAAALISANPVIVDDPGRAHPLEVRITAPATGTHLPVVIFSHGDSFSKDDYLPLTEYWAAHGFVVIQPTHLDHWGYGIPATDPSRQINWKIRAEDIHHILDSLAMIEKAVPGLAGRVDNSRLVMAGHSFGGHTTELLMGAKYIGDQSDPRFLAAVIMSAPGRGDIESELKPDWVKRGYLKLDFSGIKRPMLVIYGSEDHSSIINSGDPAWYADAYKLSPGGNKCLVVVDGANHYLGGLAGPPSLRNTDANNERFALVQQASLAFLQQAVDPKGGAWTKEAERLKAGVPKLNTFECR